MTAIDFVVEEHYRHVGFNIYDECTITISSLTRPEAERVRSLIIQMDEERGS